MENVIYRSAEAINSAMLRVYNQMCMAVIVSGVMAMAVSSSPVSYTHLTLPTIYSV